MILTKKYDYTLVRGKENERERERPMHTNTSTTHAILSRWKTYCRYRTHIHIRIFCSV